jgi:CubicO group peptidase (beta-lactamase class C family)
MSTRRQLLAFALLHASLVAQATEPVSSSGAARQTLEQRVTASAAEQFARSPVGGLSVAIVADGVSATHHFGHADGKAGPAPTGTTFYRIGSITKTFTALLFLQLESRDVCSFSDPVDKYVPEFAKIPNPPGHDVKVTLIQLATHSSGLARDPEDADALQIGPVSEWQHALLLAVPKTRYQADPGSMFSYSNIGYAFLGAALAKAAGVPYVRCVTEQVLLPLEMRDTLFELTTEQRSRLAVGHTIAENGASTQDAEAEIDGRGYRVPVGGLFSTLDDMTRWLRFQMGEPAPKVLDAAALAKAQRRITFSGPRLRSGYGIGMQILRFGETVVFGHSGGVPGYQAEMFFDPEQKVGIVILRSAVFGPFDSGAILTAAFAPSR